MLRGRKRKPGNTAALNRMKALVEGGPSPYWFSEETMAFFESRVETGLLAGDLFVTSERGPYDDSPRLFSVRKFVINTERGTVDVATIGDFQEHESLEDALIAASIRATGERVGQRRVREAAEQAKTT